ncbi:hypothetical protein Bpfe_001358, partial [Biomphalaria pfeifferi]
MRVELMNTYGREFDVYVKRINTISFRVFETNLQLHPSLFSKTVIDKGNFAPMFCAADGHPAPNTSISKGSETIAHNSSGYFLFHNKS